MIEKRCKKNFKTNNIFEISQKHKKFPFVYITNIFLRYIYIYIKDILYCAPSRVHFYYSARMVRGSGGPILRIAGVSPAMLGACKSPGWYHLTLIGPNPETGSTPVRFQTRYFSRFLHRYSSRNYAVVYRVRVKQCLRFSTLKKRTYAWGDLLRIFSFEESCFVRLRRK